MTGSQKGQPELELVHVNVACSAGAYSVGSAPFFRYILRLGAEEEVAFVSGRGWRVVPAKGDLDWPVLEATPERLRSAFERARSILWAHAAQFQVTAGEMSAIEDELDAVYGVLMRAQAAGVAVNVSYVA
jgi:hypothetical protein